MNIKVLLVLVVVGVCLPLGSWAVCQGQINNKTIVDDAPTFVKKVENGILYKMGGDIIEPNLLVGHVYGTAYEMGYAQGSMFKEEIGKVFPEMYDYIYNEVGQYLKSLPAWLQKVIEQDGIQFALEATYDLTKPFIPEHFEQEIHGIADGAGLDFDYVMRLNLFPELIQAACSMMGATGNATANTDIPGSLYQLRALDWGTTSPLQQYPLLLTYHPEAEGHNFTTLTWVGFTGAITGYSSADVGICEKLWFRYTGKENRAGYPFHFLLRDILQFDQDRIDAFSRIASAERTCSIFIGVGDSTQTFNAIAYSYEEVKIFDDHNFWQPHKNFKDVVYVDKHGQPSHDTCMPTLINQYYGSLDAEHIIRYITSQFQTGDMHLAVYDYKGRYIYVSNAAVSVDGQTPTPAYDRNFAKVSLDMLFSEPRPSSTSAAQ